MGFYFQDDYWEAVNELPIKQRNEVIVAIIEYYYTLEEPKLKGVSKAVFCAVRERVKKARQEADRKRTNRGQDADTNGTESGQNQDKNRTNSVNSLNKEGEGDIQKDIPKGISKKTPKFCPPTLDDVKAFVSEHSLSVDPQRFIDYYTANGWKVGRNAMKDWRAAIRNWSRNSYNTPAPSPAMTQEVNDELAQYFRD